MTITIHTGLTSRQDAINDADIILRRVGLPGYSSLLVELRILSGARHNQAIISDEWKATIEKTWQAYVERVGA